MSHNQKERKSHHYSDFEQKKNSEKEKDESCMYSRSHTTWSFFLQLRLFHVALRSGGLKAVQVEIRQTDVQHFFFLFGPLTCSFNLFQLHFSSYSSVHVTLKSFSRLGRYSVFFPLSSSLQRNFSILAHDYKNQTRI